LPFAVFIGFVVVQWLFVYLAEEGWLTLASCCTLTIGPKYLLYFYAFKVSAVFALLLYYRRSYSELRFTDLRRLPDTLLSLCVGSIVFVLWIAIDWSFIGFGSGSDAPTLVATAGLPPLLIGLRLFGAVLVVPLMAELFWRSFLLRYLINSDFSKVAVGTFSWSSFLVVAVLSGLLYSMFLAGVLAGVAYSLLLYRTRSVAQCVLAHAVTNLALGIYVLQTGSWQYW
jgi:CAAX prenyl protease-like protein